MISDTGSRKSSICMKVNWMVFPTNIRSLLYFISVVFDISPFLPLHLNLLIFDGKK